MTHVLLFKHLYIHNLKQSFQVHFEMFSEKTKYLSTSISTLTWMCYFLIIALITYLITILQKTVETVFCWAMKFDLWWGCKNLRVMAYVYLFGGALCPALRCGTGTLACKNLRPVFHEKLVTFYLFLQWEKSLQPAALKIILS